MEIIQDFLQHPHPAYYLLQIRNLLRLFFHYKHIYHCFRLTEDSIYYPIPILYVILKCCLSLRFKCLF